MNYRSSGTGSPTRPSRSTRGNRSRGPLRRPTRACLAPQRRRPRQGAGLLQHQGRSPAAALRRARQLGARRVPRHKHYGRLFRQICNRTEDITPLRTDASLVPGIGGSLRNGPILAGAWILATDLRALCAFRSTDRRSGGVLRDSIHRLALVAAGSARWPAARGLGSGKR